MSNVICYSQEYIKSHLMVDSGTKAIHWRKDSLSANGVGVTDIQRPNPALCTKTNSTWNMGLNVKH